MCSIVLPVGRTRVWSKPTVSIALCSCDKRAEESPIKQNDLFPGGKGLLVPADIRHLFHGLSITCVKMETAMRVGVRLSWETHKWGEADAEKENGPQ